MKIVLAGNSVRTGLIKSFFENEGFEVLLAGTPKEAKASSDGYPVIIVGSSVIPGFLIDDGYAQRVIAGLEPKAPAVMLLDRETETPSFIWDLVLKRAVGIAAGKRHVYVLARSVRTEFPGLERSYSKARAHGVTFIKYEKISVVQNDAVSAVMIDDGVMTLEIETPLLVDCTYTEDRSVLEYAEALRLHTYDGGLINADRWFLSPGRTSRRGVYYIDAGLAMSAQLEKILLSIADEIRLMAEMDVGPAAKIDPRKCAFCYTCFRLCPHGALYPDDSAVSMSVRHNYCSGCGICVSACPANAIELTERSEASGKRQPDHSKGTVAFCCENSAAIAARTVLPDNCVNVIPIPCGGSIRASQIAAALREYERVIVAVCNDGACKHFDGNKLASRQVERIREELASINIDPQRIMYIQLSHAMPNVMHNMVDNERNRAL